MADYNIQETELINLKAKLGKELHMIQVRRLTKKRDDLAKQITQRRQIKLLEAKKQELLTTVSKVYSPLFAIKDNQINGYLVYLLKMKEFFEEQVETKKEMLKQMDFEMQKMLRQQRKLHKEIAKRNKKLPAASSEFKRLENISNRMEQLNKRISTIKQENEEMMENIVSMTKFQRQFKAFEKDFRRKIDYLKGNAQSHLTKAVTAYEEKEEFMNKEKMFQNRRAQDLRKVTINENALSLCIQKIDKNEAFAKLQDSPRTDTRLAQVSDMIEKNITGLEPLLEGKRDLQTSIAEAAKAESPEKMEETFKLTDEKTASMLSYLDEILKDIHNLERAIMELKEENRSQAKHISLIDKEMRKKIQINQETAQQKLEEADKVAKFRDTSQSEADSVLERFKSLYVKCCPDDADAFQEAPLDDSNVADYLENMEKHILAYLLRIKLKSLKEASDKEKTLVIEEEDEDEDAASLKPDSVVALPPRVLKSDRDLQSLAAKLDKQETFLEFAKLQDTKMDVAHEMESGKNSDESSLSETF